jgi:hypothetical protein
MLAALLFVGAPNVVMAAAPDLLRKPARENPTADSGKAISVATSDTASRVSLPAPQDSNGISASFHWSVGAGAPSFPERDRFRLESSQRATRDSLRIDQPWDGSQLGFSSSLEAAMRWRFLRPVLGAQWTFWDSRAVLRDPRTGDLLERTWRVDQLVGQVGFDALVPKALLSINNAREPYVGWRISQGIGRLEGLGRAWAQGGGWQAHVGADVWSMGPFELGGRFGWSSMRMESSSSFARVLYEGQGADDLGWNGSGLWLELVLRLDSRKPTMPPAAKAPERVSAPR